MSVKTYNYSNVESNTAGIIHNEDGSYTALSFTASKNFKTVKSCVNWLDKRGFKADGSRKSILD